LQRPPIGWRPSDPELRPGPAVRSGFPHRPLLTGRWANPKRRWHRRAAHHQQVEPCWGASRRRSTRWRFSAL